ncbi:MAG: riboflavin synthase [Gammaproteobacteria bacterium]|nr:riboflavin synthase [Gammaproteobacteria bacterium]
MFTGLIRYRGEMLSRQGNINGERIVIALHDAIPDLEEGDSLAVNGVCLTVLDISPQRFSADLSRETLALTTLGQLYAGEELNLEPSLRLGDTLDGHLVSGHVDAIGHVRRIELQSLSAKVWVNAPARLLPLIAVKGSIAIDGVSLTVNEVDGEGFCVQLIPHTRQHSTLGALKAGQAVNLEADLLARYVTRYLAASRHDDKISE